MFASILEKLFVSMIANGGGGSNVKNVGAVNDTGFQSEFVDCSHIYIMSAQSRCGDILFGLYVWGRLQSFSMDCEVETEDSGANCRAEDNGLKSPPGNGTPAFGATTGIIFSGNHGSQVVTTQFSPHV
jgi:hypothetical protein